MKKIIIILGIVAVSFLIVFVVVNSINARKAEENKEPETVDIVIGTDENGNNITQTIKNETLVMELEGKEYSYNPNVFKEQDSFFAGYKINKNTNMSELKDAFDEEEGTICDNKGNYMYVQYVKATGVIKTVSVYSDEYIEKKKLSNRNGCSDFTFPANIKLGISTYDDVARVYGNCYSEEKKDESVIAFVCFSQEDKCSEKIRFIFDAETKVLIYTEITYNA